MSEYRCPYCGSPLTDADATRDGEALYCAECGTRVEFVDVADNVRWAMLDNLYAGCSDNSAQKAGYTGTGVKK